MPSLKTKPKREDGNNNRPPTINQALPQHGQAENMKELIQRIERIGGEKYPSAKIVKEVPLTEATMYVVDLAGDNYTVCSFIVYDDGTLFHQQDWQGEHPETAEEIGNFGWLTEEGRTAFILN